MNGVGQFIQQRVESLGGLVQRTVYPTAPVKVEYALTPDGERLGPVMGVMKEFGLWVKGKALV